VRPALFFLLLTAVFFSPVLLGGRAALPADFLKTTPVWYEPGTTVRNYDLFDAVTYTLPSYYYLKEALQRGEAPFWNPYYLAGTPAWCAGQTGYLYPPRLLLTWLLPPLWAHQASLCVHLFLAGFLMSRYARRLRLSEAAALLTGSVWMLNGYLIGWLLMDHMVICAALVPWALSAVERRRVAELALAVFGLLTCGHLQIVLYSLLLVFVVSLYRSRWAGVLGGFLLGGLLAAPLLIPTALHMQASQRPTLPASMILSTYQEFLATSLPTFVAPDAWGTPVTDFAYQRIRSGGYFIFSELCVYAGVAPLALFLMSWRQRGLPRFLMVFALVTLLVPATPLYEPLRNVVPGLNRLIATRGVLIWIFCLAVGCGFGLDGLRRSRGLAVAFLVAAGLWLAWCRWLPGAGWALRLPDRERFLSDGDYQAAVAAGLQATFSGLNVWLPVVLLGLTAGLLWTGRRSPRLWLTLAVLDLLAFGMRYIPWCPRSDVFPFNRTLARLQTGERVAGVAAFKPNTLVPFRIPDLGGYESFYLKSTAQVLAFLSGLDPRQPMPQQVYSFPRVRSPWLRLLGIRWLVTVPGQALDLPRVAETPLWIYECGSGSRVFVTGQAQVEVDSFEVLRAVEAGDEAAFVPSSPGPLGGKGEARVLDERFNRVLLEASADGPALLVLGDAYAPGWTALVDGSPAPVIPVDLMLRGVVVPAGRHRVELRYLPPGFAWGCGLALLGLLLTGKRWITERHQLSVETADHEVPAGPQRGRGGPLGAAENLAGGGGLEVIPSHVQQVDRAVGADDRG